MFGIWTKSKRHRMVSGGGIQGASRVLELRCNASTDEALEMALQGIISRKMAPGVLRGACCSRLLGY